MKRAMWWYGLSGGIVALAGALLLVGCGGAGGPSWSGSGPSYGSSGGYRSSDSGKPSSPATPAGSVRGIVEMPTRPSGLSRPVALLKWLRIGSPAAAEARLARSPLAGARVCLIDRATKESVSTTVTTDSRGEFHIANVTPSPRFSVRATDGQVTLEAVVPEGSQDVRVVVNESTTVGAEAARLVEDEGVDPEGGIRLAGRIAEAQEEYQAEHPAEVPDLSRVEDIQTRARQHLVRTADAAVAAALQTSDKAEAWQAVAAAQYLARTRMKLPAKVRLTPLQGEAIVSALVQKDTRTVNAEKILAALKKGGIKGKGGKAVTTEDLGGTLEALCKVFPSLKETKLDKLPVVVALLMVEQNGTGFQVSTREQMKGFLKELVGDIEESRGKPAAKATPASGRKGKKGSGSTDETAKPASAEPETPAKGEGETAPPAEKPTPSEG